MKKILKGADGAIFFAIYRQYFSKINFVYYPKSGQSDAYRTDLHSLSNRLLKVLKSQIGISKNDRYFYEKSNIRNQY
ncbi:unnamed protein product [Rhizophagus irregularis]|uniref:uncharacterized protein n=1 Tax=Rhizophagus irregularis TaxID=588596 RepID=UPI0019E7715F|nr:hypothetical protein OCT59_019867 [Rhizophagus irregularis]GET59680.1 hypothetical protein RIR_jg41217.t1 [Rhizophagus irregularis DAOM 181602=DAOM 197198]CAB4413048.1 unnamed protein product [Rhizophagus irregularis]